MSETADRLTVAIVSTHDSNLAQFLIFSGHRAQCHINEYNAAEFTFKDCPELRQIAEAFTHGAMVPAIAYAEAGRVVRRLILSARRRQQESGQ